jgi:hypothetical protein
MAALPPDLEELLAPRPRPWSGYLPPERARIAEKIGECLPGRDCAELLDQYNQDARDFMIKREDTTSERKWRDQLIALAEAIERASDELDFGAGLYLEFAAHEHGLPLDYLGKCVKAVRAAAAMPPVKAGPKRNKPLADFIYALSWKYEDFTGREATITNNHHRRGRPTTKSGTLQDPFSGAFFEVVVAAVEPLGVRRLSNQALGELIKENRRRLRQCRGTK